MKYHSWWTQAIYVASGLCLILLAGPRGMPALDVTPACAASHASVQPVAQHYSLGDVRLTLSADRQTVGLADQVRLTLSIETPTELLIAWPEVAKRLGPFVVRQQRTLGPQITGQHTWQWHQEYLLEADAVGVLPVPPLTVQFRDSTAAPTSAFQQLTTTPYAVTVASLVPAAVEVTAIQDIAPPVLLSQRGGRPWLWLTAGVLGGVALLGGGWWYRHRRRRATEWMPPQPAHGLALAALQRLQRDGLVGQRRVDEFYTRLSHILRQYVGWRFGLQATEQTTEELLHAVLATEGPLTTYRALLDAVLRHGDLVKFARYQPDPETMRQDWVSVKAFVEQTADDHSIVTAPQQGAPLR